jgi:hypothetical protein
MDADAVGLNGAVSNAKKAMQADAAALGLAGVAAAPSVAPSTGPDPDA